MNTTKKFIKMADLLLDRTVTISDGDPNNDKFSDEITDTCLIDLTKKDDINDVLIVKRLMVGRSRNGWEVVYHKEMYNGRDDPPHDEEILLCVANTIDGVIEKIVIAEMQLNIKSCLDSIEEEEQSARDGAPNLEECINLLQELTEKNLIDNAGPSDIANDILTRHDAAKNLCD